MATDDRDPTDKDHVGIQIAGRVFAVMKITSRSLHHANIVFVFDESRFLPPENHLLTSFYRGEAAIGSRFVDDPIMRTKILDLPKIKLQVTVEPGRLKVDDGSQEEPDKSSLIEEAEKIYRQFFQQNKLTGFGFNFDVYYQTDRVVRLEDLFDSFAGKEALRKRQLLHLGWQFTLEKDGGDRRETYFVKITAPMEVAVHANYHFSLNPPSYLKLPELPEMKKNFRDCYRETDELIKALKF